MPDTARKLFEKLAGPDKYDFHDKARMQIRRRLYPQHRSLANDYYQRAFAYWWNSKKILEKFEPGLVVIRAHHFYREDLQAGRLRIEEYQDHADHADTSKLAGFTSNPSPESILNNKKLIDLIKSVWPAKYLHYLEAILVHQPYRGSEIDNDELARIVGVDIEDVRRALDCARKKLQRHGLSRDMIW
jgi:hypothetical protein